MKRPVVVVRSESELPLGYQPTPTSILYLQTLVWAWALGMFFQFLVAAPVLMDTILFFLGLGAAYLVAKPIIEHITVHKFKREVKKL